MIITANNRQSPYGKVHSIQCRCVASILQIIESFLLSYILRVEIHNRDKNMKNYCLFFLTQLVFLNFCSVVYADMIGINVISEENYIWGFAGDSGPGETLATYDISSVSPDIQTISADVSGSYYDRPDYLEPSRSTASAGNFNIDVMGGRWRAWASGVSIYEFTTESNILNLYATGYTDTTSALDFVRLSLRDVTTGLKFFDYSFQNNYPTLSFDFEKIFNVDSNHKYMLYMFAEAGTADSTASSGLTCNISSALTPVPEPSIMYLLTTGLAGLVVVGGRKKYAQKRAF